MARLRTDHTRLIHGFLMSRRIQIYSNDCFVPLTVQHLLVKCPSLRDQQEQYLSQCRDGDGILSFTCAGRGDALTGAYIGLSAGGRPPSPWPSVDLKKLSCFNIILIKLLVTFLFL